MAKECPNTHPLSWKKEDEEKVNHIKSMMENIPTCTQVEGSAIANAFIFKVSKCVDRLSHCWRL